MCEYGKSVYEIKRLRTVSGFWRESICAEHCKIQISIAPSDSRPIDVCSMQVYIVVMAQVSHYPSASASEVQY